MVQPLSFGSVQVTSARRSISVHRVSSLSGVRMSWFRQLVKNPLTIYASAISIDMDEFEQGLRESLLETVEWSENTYERLKGMQIDPNDVSQKLTQCKYPGAQQLVQLLESGNVEAIFEHFTPLLDHVRELANQRQYDDADLCRETARLVSDYADSISGRRIVYTKEEAARDFARIRAKTLANMRKITDAVVGAIERIGNRWNGTAVSIEPDVPTNATTWKPDHTLDADSAHINLHGQHSTPNFAYWPSEEGLMLEDILDAGDADSFSGDKLGQTLDQDLQEDYFNLIKEIRSPGSTSQAGKILTLYTARPVADRVQFMEASKVPPNIWLTSNYQRAQGIASDLSGSETLRDIWRIRIDENYLQPSQAGTAMDYQITSREPVPVRSIKLVDPGE